MKIIFISDLHSHNSHLYSLPADVSMTLPNELEFLKRKPYWHLLTDRMIDSLLILRHVYLSAVASKAERIYHLGDLFHKKTPGLALAVMVDVLNEFHEKFERELCLLPGNHDSFKAWSYLSALVRPGAITLLDGSKAEIIKPSLRICPVPYTTKISEWQGQLEYLTGQEKKLTTLLLFHQDILGFRLPSGHQLQTGVDLASVVKLIDIWFSGHIHVYTKTKNGACIGSALPINFTDAGSEHGYILLETSSCQWKFQSFPDELIPGFARVQLKDIRKVSRLDFPDNTEYLWVDVVDQSAKRTQLEAIRIELEKHLRYVYLAQPIRTLADKSSKQGDKERRKMFIDKRYAITEWAKEKGIDPDLGLEIYDQVSST